MENSTQTATAIVPFVSFEQTSRAKFMALKSVEKKIKGHITKAFKLDVNYEWVKSAKRFVFSPTGQSIDIADLYEEAKPLQCTSQCCPARTKHLEPVEVDRDHHRLCFVRPC